jgi:hypothetical protein
MTTDKQGRLAETAERLQKSVWLIVAILGAGRPLKRDECSIPDYGRARTNLLKRHIVDLEVRFEKLATLAFLQWNRGRQKEASTWLAARYDEWHDVGFGVLEIGRVHEVEAVVGPLANREVMECPAYAQVVLQGFEVGAAIRHPEYHLASDVALFYNLLLDADGLVVRASRENDQPCSEHVQSLARAVILTCFNLLESFTSGLASSWLLANPAGPPDVVNALQGKDAKGRDMSLCKRFCLFPALISGKPKLDETKQPLVQLFKECKRRRDSFVHCEPGPTPSKWGYVKERHFHEADLASARKTVDLTWEAICLAWKTVYPSECPRWLLQRDDKGRFPRTRVQIQPVKRSG